MIVLATRQNGYPVRFAGEIPPFVSIPFYGSCTIKSHLVKSIKYKPLIAAICFWPRIWPVWCH